jgi:hypothetical protein
MNGLVRKSVSFLLNQSGITPMYQNRENMGGFIAAPIVTLIAGVLFLVFGLILSDIVLSQAATSGGSATIGSFSGAQSMNDLVPFIYYAVVVIGGVGLIGIGAKGMTSGVR